MPFRIIRVLRHYPFRHAGYAAVLCAVGWLIGRAEFFAVLAHVLTLLGLSALATLSGWWIAVWLLPTISTGRWVHRRDDESQHAGGVATWLDIGERAGGTATRAKAHILRPSLRRHRWFHLRATRLSAYAVPLVRAGWLPIGSTVWSTCEEVTLRIGGPRSRKSASLACHALDAPGALLVTTSRTDLLDGTRKVRAARGRVDVFNPTGLGKLASTVRWSPLVGCDNLGTAQRRAQDLIPTATGDAERWDTQARGLLAVLMHAAALSGGSMRTVVDWVSPADVIACNQILSALAGSPSSRALSSEIRSIYSTNERTLTSITATLLPAVRWLTDATAAEVGDADLSDPAFLDVEALVAKGTDSLYLIGREGNCRPLIGALTAEVAHQVRMIAAAKPGGRLDPPMTAILDEAPLTCGPIPLHDWTSDMGGRGLTLHIVAQSLAQLRDVWGDDRAATILGNTSALMAFGGIKSADDLDQLSTLCGTRLVQLDQDDRRPIPVMTAAEISALPPGTALLLKTALRPIVGRAPTIWDREPSALGNGLGYLARFVGSAVRALVRGLRHRPVARPIPGTAAARLASVPPSRPVADDGPAGESA